MPPHPLTIIELQKFYLYLKINLDEYESIGFHWISLYVNTENVTHFDSLGVEHISKKLQNSLETKIFDFMLKGKSLLEYKKIFSPNK